MLQVAKQVLQSAPCAVACQLLMRAAPPQQCPTYADGSGGTVGEVAQAATQAWAHRSSDVAAQQEAQHEGMLACVARGWPWFAVAAAATQVLSVDKAGGAAAAGMPAAEQVHLHTLNDSVGAHLAILGMIFATVDC